MPGLIFPISANGLHVPALIGHDATQMQVFQAAGTPLPTPLHVRALLDTGSDVTAVGPSALNSLGLISAGSVQTQTAGGVVTVQFYKIGIALFDPASSGGVTFFRPSWTVTSLHQDLPDVEVLIGMDLISELLLIIDGPAKRFTLSF